MKKVKIKKASAAYYLHIVGATATSLIPITATVVEKAIPVARAVVATTLPVMAYFRAGEAQAIAIDISDNTTLPWNTSQGHINPSSIATSVGVPTMRVSEIPTSIELKDAPSTQTHGSLVAVEPDKSDFV
jgi:hypothetical protein